MSSPNNNSLLWLVAWVPATKGWVVVWTVLCEHKQLVTNQRLSYFPLDIKKCTAMAYVAGNKLRSLGSHENHKHLNQKFAIHTV